MAGKQLTLNMITEAGEIRPTTGVLPSAPLFLHHIWFGTDLTPNATILFREKKKSVKCYFLSLFLWL